MQALSKRVDQVLEAAVAGQRIVGAVSLIARRGTRIYQRAIGLADREAGRAMTEATPFRLASLTKQVVTVASLALIERGALALDAPVTRWLPEFTPRAPDGTTPPITIHQLLTHTSGLGYAFLELAGGPYHQANVSDGLDQPGLSIGENLRRLASVPLRAAPGTAFNYSLSTDVLGAVLERAGDAPLPQLIADLVTGPLGTPSLQFTASPEVGAALAAAYSDGVPADGIPPRLIRSGAPVAFPPFAVAFAPERALDPASYPSGGAGLVGTADDYLRFLEAIRTRSIPGVPAARIDAMLADQIPGVDIEMVGPGWGYGYNVSVLRDPIAAGSTLSRGAVRWGGAYGHCWFIDPETETSSVLLTNTAFEGMTGALRTEVEQAIEPAIRT